MSLSLLTPYSNLIQIKSTFYKRNKTKYDLKKEKTKKSSTINRSDIACRVQGRDI